MAVQIERRLFTTNEYEQMIQAGVFGEDERLELIAGEIIEMTPISSGHAGHVNRLVRLFTRLLGDRALTAVQNPIQLGEHSEPQPDLALLRPRADDYIDSHPRAEDVLLLIEVCETSLDYDRKIKAPLYARSGIVEVWLVSLIDHCVEVYREPRPTGYRTHDVLQLDDSISPLAFPDTTVDMSAILG
jgi:Uma2 family endonuclease